MIRRDDPSSQAEHVAAIILAAGRSQRMGALKPLLPFGKTTVLESCIDYLRAGGVQTIVVVVGHRADEIRLHLKGASVIFVENPDVGGEMASSIACGVSALPIQTKAIVITPADLPAVPFELVAGLISEWQKGHSLVKPTWKGRGGHPVLIDVAFRERLTRLDRDRGLKSLFDSHADQVRRLPVESEYIARDLDTWDDYATLHLDVFGQLPAPLANLESAGGVTRNQLKG